MKQPRKRNPRVVMREKMMEAKGWLHAMTEAWLVGRDTFDTQVGEPGWNASRRRRRPEEYPENRVDELRNLIKYVRGIRYRLDEVEQMALRRIAEIEEEKRRG